MTFLPTFDRRIPYVAVDVDAAFVGPVPDISKRNADAFMECCGSGQIAFFCTGRGRKESLRILYNLCDVLPLYQGYPGVYHSGAIILDKGGNLIHGTYFSNHTLTRILDTVRYACFERMAIFCSFDKWMVLSDDHRMLERAMDESGLYMPLFVSTREEILNSDISQILIYQYRVISRSLAPYDNVCFKIRRDQRAFVQLAPLGVTPARGIWRLMRHYNIRCDMCSYVGYPCEISDFPTVAMEGRGPSSQQDGNRRPKNVIRVINPKCVMRPTNSA
ncbi:haloacid dehalogenase-like hydrolase family member protein [Babesia ovis]|uniref:Haloacid dehalogenase-like hydrolase family member protein n=1 Tax=Babesia ovis TaxID=5869 RepID=A0A9W5TDK5_BABOV|nr:haloacid dehalogenase-like hydrolase family member protein [Babesia ovis]